MDDKSARKYKKYTMFALIVTAAALVICAAALSLKRDAVAVQGNPEKNYTSYYTPKPSPSQESQNFPESSEIEEEYLVTVYNGKIGVFRGGEAKPFLTADTDVYLLPDEDVAILRKGIRAKSFSEVKGILEDYE